MASRPFDNALAQLCKQVFVQEFTVAVFFPTDRLPPAERRGYSSVFNALSRMAKEEGVLTLWRVGFMCHMYPVTGNKTVSYRILDIELDPAKLISLQ